MKANPIDIFNYVMEDLPPGQTLVIKCDNEKQMDRIRMSLHRQRNKLEKIAPSIASIITISKRTKEDDLAVIIGKNIEEFNFAIIDSEGNEAPLEEKISTGTTDNEKIRRRMLQDGKNEEEIEEYFQNN